MKVILAIPCYNCELQLGRVLDGIDAKLATLVEDIWVVDNCSMDGTLEVAERYRASSQLPTLRVFKNNENVNLGGTHKAVFTHARSQEFTHVVILHGDDQATASEAADLISAAQAGSAQTVLGSRFSRGAKLSGYDWKRIVGNHVLNVIYSIGARRRLTDLGSGLNLFFLNDLEPDTYMRFGNRLSFNYELVLDLIRRDIDFIFQPISWSESDQTSNARNVTIFREALAILARWKAGRPTTSPTSQPSTPYEWIELV